MGQSITETCPNFAMGDLDGNKRCLNIKVYREDPYGCIWCHKGPNGAAIIRKRAVKEASMKDRRVFKVSWGTTLDNGAEVEKGRGRTEARTAGDAVGMLREAIPRGMDWVNAKLKK